MTIFKKLDEANVNEGSGVEMKRKAKDQPSSTVSYGHQEQYVTTTVTQKLKLGEDDIAFCGDDSEEDKENGETDLF